MHIPDGLIAPKMYIPLHLFNAGLVIYGFKQVKRVVDDRTLPYIASLSALSFVFMLLQVPLPGGTSVHVVGVAPLSIIFGPWIGFISISLVLLVQVIFMGVGGITSFPINALCIGFIGSFTSYYIHLVAKKVFPHKVALFFASFMAIIVAAFSIAVALGIQPIISHDNLGSPLYFPFGMKTTIPLLLVSHIFVAIGEGILTLLLYSFVKNRLVHE